MAVTCETIYSFASALSSIPNANIALTLRLVFVLRCNSLQHDGVMLTPLLSEVECSAYWEKDQSRGRCHSPILLRVLSEVKICRVTIVVTIYALPKV